MNISARLENSREKHTVTLATEGRKHSVEIAPKPGGSGSSVNGGELLFLALATCYCNDLYREAGKRGIDIVGIQVEVSGEFPGEGCGASGIRYRAVVDATASREDILELMRYTDSVAEIQATVRNSAPVVLASCEANEV